MISRNLDKAKEAFKNKDVKATIKAHRKGEFHSKDKEMHLTEKGMYIKSVIYGGLDGIITTFAVVSGVAGASLSGGIVLILGFANLIADGISMGIGDYLSSKAQNEYEKAERKREEWEIDHYPQGEKKEMVEIFVSKGMKSSDAKEMVNIMSTNKRVWLDIMMSEELGIIESKESPKKSGFITFGSFVFFGFIPLLAYVILFLLKIQFNAFLYACILTGATLFLLGTLKVRITKKNWLKSGFEMLFVGGIAAVLAYGIGYILSGLA